MSTTLNILIIEDNLGDMLLTRQHLLNAQDLKFKVYTARSLEAGMTSVRDTHFDAILLDLSLPDSFGLETLVNIRECAPNVPIIITTGFEDEAHKAHMLSAGAQDYLSKNDLNGKSLAVAIQSAIERKQNQQKS